MNEVNGIIVYQIQTGGNLMAQWANRGDNRIYTEMAIKRDGRTDSVTGTYNCAFFENNSLDLTECILIIRSANNIYEFEWRAGRTENGTLIYRGIGLDTSENQIAVSYWNV